MATVGGALANVNTAPTFLNAVPVLGWLYVVFKPPHPLTCHPHIGHHGNAISQVQEQCCQTVESGPHKVQSKK